MPAAWPKKEKQIPRFRRWEIYQEGGATVGGGRSEGVKCGKRLETGEGGKNSFWGGGSG